MRKIIYKFDDGTTSKVAVEDSFFEQYQALVKEQEKFNRKETRRHYSLEQLLNYGWDREDTKVDIAYQLELKEQIATLKEAFKNSLKGREVSYFKCVGQAILSRNRSKVKFA